MILAALFQAGLTIGITVGDSFFLSNIGIDKLPYIYIAMPLIMLVYASIVSNLISKYGIEKLLIRSIFAVIFAVSVIYVLALFRESLPANLITIFYYSLKVFAALTYIAFYSLYWNYVDLYFDMSEGKKQFAYLSAGTALGVIIGGGIVYLLADILGIASLLLIWVLLSIISLPIISHITRTFKEIVIRDYQEKTEKENDRSLNFKWLNVFKLKYVYTLAIMVFIVSLLGTIMEYQYYDIFSSLFSEEELASKIGWLFAMVNLFNLIVCGLLFNVLVLRFGVTNIAMIQPVVYMLSFAYLLLDYGYYAAIFGFLAYQGFAWSVDNNNYNLLYNALPNSNRAQLRTILEGILEPLATAVAGIYLILLASNIPAEGISFLGFISAIFLFALVLFLKRNYLKSLTLNLKSEWLDFSKKIFDFIPKLSGYDLSLTESKGKHNITSDPILSYKLIKQYDSKKALSFFLDLLGKYQFKNNSLLSTDLAFFEEELIFYLELDNYHNIKDITHWFNNHEKSIHPHILEILAFHGLIEPGKIKAYLLDTDKELVNVGLIAMLGNRNLVDFAITLDEVQLGLYGDDHNAIMRSLRILLYCDHPRYINAIMPFIGHNNMEIRLLALKALKANIKPSSQEYLPSILDALSKNTGILRAICIEIISKINDPTCIEALIIRSSELPPSERRLINELIFEMGITATPFLVSVMNDNECNENSKFLAAQLLNDVAPEQYEILYPELINNQILLAEQLSLYAKTLSTSDKSDPSIQLLYRYYHDSRISKINFVLKMLSIAGRIPVYELMVNSLNSTNPKIKAFGYEALEQGVDNRLFNRIINQLVTNEKIDGVKQNNYITLEEVINHSIISNNPAEKLLGIMCMKTINYSKWSASIRDIVNNDYHSLFTKPVLERLTEVKQLFRNDIYDRLHILNESDFFKSWHFEHLLYLARKSELIFSDTHTYLAFEDKPLECLFIHAYGDYKVTYLDNTTNISEKGTVFPTILTYLQPKTGFRISTSSGVVLQLPVNALEQCAKLYPEAALNLYKINSNGTV